MKCYAGNSVYLGNRVASQKKAQEPKNQEEGKKRRKGGKRKRAGNWEEKRGEEVGKKTPKKIEKPQNHTGTLQQKHDS